MSKINNTNFQAPAIALMCKSHDYEYIPATNTFVTGDWVISKYRQEELLGEKVVLTDSSKNPAYLGGRIVGFGGNGTGTFNYNVRTVYTDYTFVPSDYYVGVMSNSAVTITLPPGEEGRICVVKDQSSNCSIHNLTINPQGSDKIDNQNSVILALNNAAVDMIFTNGGWRII